MSDDLPEAHFAGLQNQINARSVIARVLQDPTRKAWEMAQTLPADAFLCDPDCRSIYMALKAGANYADHLDISKRSRVSLAAIESIVMEDSVGAEAYFKIRLSALKEFNQRRELQLLANEIYEHKTLDFEHWKGRLDRLKETEGESSPEAQLRERLASRLFNFITPPPEPIPRFLINGKAFSTPGNLTNFIAQAKAGKTAFIAACIAAWICAVNQRDDADTLGVTATAPENLRLIHFDTEQSLFDHDGLVRRALRRAGAENPPSSLVSYGLAGFSAQELRNALRLALEDAKKAGGVFAVIIDGTADLVNDVNDAEECNAFVADLHALAIAHDCPIINVVHENPGQDGGKMRGHLGSQLERKAESNIRLRKTDEITVVFSDKMRRAPILEKDGPRFAWSDESGMHVSVESAGTSRDDEKRAELTEILESAFAGEKLKYAEACLRVQNERGCVRTTAERILSKALKLGVLKKSGLGFYELSTRNPQ